MNFKPTLLKSVVSLLVGFAVNYFTATGVDVLCMCDEDAPCYCPQPTWFESAFDPAVLVMSVLTILVVYVIWSLVQKGEKK